MVFLPLRRVFKIAHPESLNERSVRFGRARRRIGAPRWIPNYLAASLDAPEICLWIFSRLKEPGV